MATYSAFCPISGLPQEGARLFRAVLRGPVIPSEDDTIKIAMLTSALRDASGGTGCRRMTVQKRAAAGDGGEEEEGGGEGGGQHPGGTRGRVLVSSFRSAAGRKGIILIADSLGRPNSTPCFYSLSLPLILSLSCSLSSSTCETPHTDSVSFLRRVSCVIFLPHPFSLLRFVGEHIPSLAAVTAGVSRLARVCLPS